jgi:PBP1b-binding outer membrane lipoprotein LpoB
MMKRILFLLLPIILILTGCATEADPGDAIMKYLEARLASDVDQLRELSCADWESQVPLQAASFQSIDASLENASCKANGTQDGMTVVECTGKIVYQYNGERNERELGNFLVTQENGEWKMCGEAE